MLRKHGNTGLHLQLPPEALQNDRKEMKTGSKRAGGNTSGREVAIHSVSMEIVRSVVAPTEGEQGHPSRGAHWGALRMGRGPPLLCGGWQPRNRPEVCVSLAVVSPGLLHIVKRKRLFLPLPPRPQDSRGGFLEKLKGGSPDSERLTH